MLHLLTIEEPFEMDRDHWYTRDCCNGHDAPCQEWDDDKWCYKNPPCEYCCEYLDTEGIYNWFFYVDPDGDPVNMAICTGWGGPNIWQDFHTQKYEVYWWGSRNTRDLTWKDDDDFSGEIFNFFFEHYWCEQEEGEDEYETKTLTWEQVKEHYPGYYEWKTKQETN